MIAGDWPEIERLYLAASDLAQADRAGFLEHACAGLPSLRAEVEGLLNADLARGPFLELPPSLLAADLLERARGGPASIGPYRIVRLLGEGGMGTVYQAEQQTPQRMVALKVIKAGMISDEVLRRFERESEALGRLQHHGIAQIHDAGTADSGFGPQPYFAMEFIQGRPLMDYASQRVLNVRARLELMAKVCDAVNHAHQRGILHRDLKPGNILVDETGQPKILDFGVARIMDADTQATRQTDLGQLIGTLAYMSPEQALGNLFELDIRSDVYALGVILYELLAGKVPYQTKGTALHEAVRAIREEDPAPLGALDRGYRGDIETIVAKALEKDKERRYASAGQLAGDIRLYLADRPIMARPPTATYQLRKFSRRHRVVVIATAAVLFALIAGVIVSTWQVVRARAAERAALAQRDRADAEAAAAKLLFDQVRQLANSFLFEINDAIKDLPGSTPARLLLVTKSLTYLDKLALRASHDLSLQNELAEGYRKIGEVQYAVGGANLGDISGALGSARKEVAIRDKIAPRDDSLGAQLALAKAYVWYSEMLQGTGSPAESDAYLNKALVLRAALYQKYPTDQRLRSDVAASYRSVADKELLKANPQGALDLNRKALAIRQELVRQHPENASYRRQLSIDLVRIADALGSPGQPNLGRFAEARKTYEEALSIREALRQSSPGSVTAARDVCNVRQRQGTLLVQMKEYRNSLQSSAAAQSILASFWKADPANFEIRRDMAVIQSQTASAYDGMRDDMAAENAHRKALAIYQELQRKNPKSDRSQDDLAGARSAMGQWLTRHGREREALQYFSAARVAFVELMQRNPDAGFYERKVVRAVGGLADVHMRLGDRVSACGEYRDALVLANRLQVAGRLKAADQNEPGRFRRELAGCQ